MNEEQKKDSKIDQVISKGKKFLHPDYLKLIIIGLIIFVAVFLIFGAGVWIGERKAGFSYRWAEQYQRNFAGPRAGFFNDWQSFPKGDFIEAHGIFGQIMKIDASTSSGPTLVIKGIDEVEKIVLIKKDTIIKSLRETVKITDLKVDDYIVVVGEPNDGGQIEAKFIRLVPPPRETSFDMPMRRMPMPNL
jgi:hypothetical protein